MERMTRREFVEVAGLLGACGCGLSGCATFTKVGHTPAIEPAAYALGSAETLTVTLDKTPTLADAGSAVKIMDPALPEPLILVHVEGERYVAASLRCTHRGVELEYREEEQTLRCASLGHSEFALDGRRLGGPASRPLKTYPASVANGVLTVSLGPGGDHPKG
jgi:cytochrome b6-f complex iron-sulfur subunit